MESGGLFCSCGRAAGGRCTECGKAVCYWPHSWDRESSCGRMHEGRLLCPADREAAESSRRSQGKESREADHRAWVERIRAAAPEAAATLKAGGRPPLALATVDGVVKGKSSAYGDRYRSKSSWEAKERLGYGWILFTATHDQLEGARTQATVVLVEGGRLFWAESEKEVELGPKRLLGGPRETVLPVIEELDLDEKPFWDPAKEQALRELEAQLSRRPGRGP